MRGAELRNRGAAAIGAGRIAELERRRGRHKAWRAAAKPISGVAARPREGVPHLESRGVCDERIKNRGDGNEVLLHNRGLAGGFVLRADRGR